MGCVNDKQLRPNKVKRIQYQNKYKQSNNPIIKIAKQWDLQIIKDKWQDNQYLVIKSKLGPKIQKLSKQQFIKLIPQLSKFSSRTQDNFYQLFNFEENQQLSIDNFVITQIIILKSDDYDLLSDMFFFAYSSQSTKNIMNQNDYNLFSKQFKQHQLQFMHHTIKPTKNEKGQLFIDRKLFKDIFEQYDIKTIKLLFRFNLKQQQRNFQKYLATYGIDRKNQAPAFILDFQWFLKWKNYMEYKYGIKLVIKQNGRQLDKQKNILLSTTTKNNEHYQKAGQKLASEAGQNHMEPINNDRIQGQQNNQIKQGLIEFADFISVNSDTWKQMRIIYGGSPQIHKPFPHFYNKKIMLTILDQSKCQFQPGFAKAMIYDPNQTFEEIYNKRKEKYFSNRVFDELIAYYKHPGQLEWKKISNLNIKLQNFPFQFKSFLVFVEVNNSKKFQQKFNVTDNKNGKKQMKQRIKNFGNILSFQHDGIVQQGHVGSILPNSVVIYLKTAKGQYQKIQNKFADLQKLNPNTLDDYYLQGFAGLQNTGNTCYINAPLQCLLKTPCFDEYLDSVNLDRNRKDMLTYQLHQIYQKSRDSRDCISMSNFKKTFDQKFTFFQGSAQHDAQQFLLLLLDKLSQQQPRQSLMTSGIQSKSNKKIHNFFSGKTKAQTQCIKCHKKGVTQQSFFTYSLSLPIINETIFAFYYIDNSYKVNKYGLTIDRDCEIGDIIKMIEKQLKYQQSQLMIMSVCEGQWMNDILKLSSSYKIAKLQNFDSSIVCYSINNNVTPDYQDLVQGRTKNSIKLQVRNRVYDQKKKTAKPFHFPFFVEINHQTTGKSLTYSIIDKIKKFVNQQEYHVFKQFQQDMENQYLKLLQSNQTGQNFNKNNDMLHAQNDDLQRLHNSPSKYTQTPQQNQKSKSKFKDMPFTIEYLKNQDGLKSICWFCKKNIDHNGKQRDSKSTCLGCQFVSTEKLYQNKNFMKGFKNLLITIDWKSQLFSKDWTIQETKSFIQAKKQQMSRRSNLQKMVKQTQNIEQTIDLKCQKVQCQYTQAIRKQIIMQAPNILILHLKRFYYKDNTFHKLKNKVLIQPQLSLPGFNDKYELYGNVVHYGSGTGRGGHYINYVKVNNRWYKCDDQKVYFTQSPNEHLNPDAYLLFYKKTKMDKTMMSLFGF